MAVDEAGCDRFKTERLDWLNRRGSSAGHAGVRVFPREFVEASTSARGRCLRADAIESTKTKAGSEDPAYVLTQENESRVQDPACVSIDSGSA
jgi:hypothetical protein